VLPFLLGVFLSAPCHEVDARVDYTAGTAPREPASAIGTPEPDVRQAANGRRPIVAVDDVQGGGDQPLSMIGSGICRPGDGLALNPGTGSQVARVSTTYRPGRGDCITFCFPGGGWSVLGAVLCGGAAMRWWQGVLAQATGGADGPSVSRLSRAAGRVPPGADGLVFVPLLSGSRWQPEARASFLGLRDSHTQAHMTRAIMEGVVLELYGLWRGQGGRRAGTVTASGGGFTSPVWRRIAADVFGAPLRMAVVGEQAALGAALLAGLGAGCYRSLRHACAAVRYRRPVVEPRPEITHLYRRLWRERAEPSR